jgi:hypothetical protein
MADRKKQAGTSGKKIARRDEPEAKAAEPQGKARTEPEPEGPPIRQRIREENSGFGVIKVACGVIIFLIIGAGVLGRLAGSDRLARGNKPTGARCEATEDCSKGSICYGYEGDPQRCMKTCDSRKICDSGYTCTSSLERTGRRSSRVRAVCVGDARLR